MFPPPPPPPQSETPQTAMFPPKEMIQRKNGIYAEAVKEICVIIIQQNMQYSVFQFAPNINISSN